MGIRKSARRVWLIQTQIDSRSRAAPNMETDSMPIEIEAYRIYKNNFLPRIVDIGERVFGYFSTPFRLEAWTWLRGRMRLDRCQSCWVWNQLRADCTKLSCNGRRVSADLLRVLLVFGIVGGSINSSGRMYEVTQLGLYGASLEEQCDIS